MRLSPHRHPVAILRSICGFRLKEFAGVLGCNIGTLQAVELGRRRLQPDLAAAISSETGVSVAWLLAGDAAAPPVDDEGRAYSKEAYEHHKSGDKDPMHFGVFGSVMVTNLCFKVLALSCACLEGPNPDLAPFRRAYARLIQIFEELVPKGTLVNGEAEDTYSLREKMESINNAFRNFASTFAKLEQVSKYYDQLTAVMEEQDTKPQSKQSSPPQKVKARNKSRRASS